MEVLSILSAFRENQSVGSSGTALSFSSSDPRVLLALCAQILHIYNQYMEIRNGNRGPGLPYAFTCSMKA